MDETELEEIKKYFEKEQKKEGLKVPEQHVCPHCGRCPVCGRPREVPYYPYPYWPSPYYPTVTWGSDAVTIGSRAG